MGRVSFRRFSTSAIGVCFSVGLCLSVSIAFSPSAIAQGLPVPAPPRPELDYPAIEPQQAMTWCWASAAQNVLAQFGIRQTQPEIVARMANVPVFAVGNRKANAAEVAALLRSYGLRARWLGRTLSDRGLLEALAQGYVVIADTLPPFTGEHADVIRHYDGNRVLISDPMLAATWPITVRELRWRFRWIKTVLIAPAESDDQ